MKDSNQLFTILFVAFCAAMVARSLYKAFFIKAETPSDYMKKAHYAVSFFKARRYSINLLQKALDTFDNLTEEEYSYIHFQIGLNQYYQKKFETAAVTFDKAWPFLKKSKIPYSRAYAAIVVSNYNIGKKEKAREIYHYLIKKQSYDPKFADLQYLEQRIFR